MLLLVKTWWSSASDRIARGAPERQGHSQSGGSPSASLLATLLPSPFHPPPPVTPFSCSPTHPHPARIHATPMAWHGMGWHANLHHNHPPAPIHALSHGSRQQAGPANPRTQAQTREQASAQTHPLTRHRTLPPLGQSWTWTVAAGWGMEFSSWEKKILTTP
jgi:hypothetical protein